MFAIITSILFLTPLIYLFTNKFLPFHESRIELNCIYDPILNRLPLIDTHAFIAGLIVVSHVPLVVFFDEYKLVCFLWCTTITNYTKLICLALCPLKIHPDYYVIKPLKTSVEETNSIFIRATDPYIQDLFFSGHVSMVIMLAYCYPNLKYMYCIIGILLSCCLLLSRIHYSIDIFIAPFVVSCTYMWTLYIVHLLYPTLSIEMQ